MGSNGEQGQLLKVPAEVVPSKLIITYKGYGSSEFILSGEGKVTPTQKYVVAGWLDSDIGRGAVAFESEHPTPDTVSGIADPGTLIFEFEAPGSALFTVKQIGRIHLNQLWSAANWMRWSSDLDFTVDVQLRSQAASQQMAQQQQIQQMLGRAGRH